ncbi:MAG: hypothetical protein U1F43_09030 [Myxococcota bacterium]
MAEIVHIALVKLDAENDDALARDYVVEHAYRLLPLIPGVTSFQVARALPEVIALSDAQAHHTNAPPEKSWDLALTFRLGSAAAHERFKLDPDRLAFFDQFLRPKAVALKAWSFEVLESQSS